MKMKHSIYRERGEKRAEHKSTEKNAGQQMPVRAYRHVQNKTGRMRRIAIEKPNKRNNNMHNGRVVTVEQNGVVARTPIL